MSLTREARLFGGSTNNFYETGEGGGYIGERALYSFLSTPVITSKLALSDEDMFARQEPGRGGLGG